MKRRDAVNTFGTSVAARAVASVDGWASVNEQGGPGLVRPVPSSGELLPVIGLGTWQTFDVGSSARDRAPLEAVLSGFVELGGKMIDSSPMYGKSESVVGDIAAKLGLRSKLFVATKVWTPHTASGGLLSRMLRVRALPATLDETRGVDQMEESIAKLRARPIDLMQVHNLVDVHTHLATLREWKRDGRVRYIGITHHTARALADVERVADANPVDFIQINYSVGERDAERRLLPFARERGIAVIANRPFAGGDVFRRLLGKPLPVWAGDIDCTSWAQVLLKFVLSHSAITCAIPGTGKVEHLRDNMRAGHGRLPGVRLRARIAADAI